MKLDKSESDVGPMVTIFRLSNPVCDRKKEGMELLP